MPIFNLSHFNLSNEFIRLSETPIPSTYSNVKIFGGGTFDDLHVVNEIYSQTKIDSLDMYSQPIWGVHTIALGYFNDNLQFGNITTLPSPIDAWLVFRKSKYDSKFTKIGEMESAETIYIDRLAKSRNEYTYQLTPKAGDTLGLPLEADPVATDFIKVVLIDETTEEGYLLCLDINEEFINTNEDFTQVQTKGKYDTFMKGNRNFASGDVNVVVQSNSITEFEISQDINFLSSFESFILNGNKKIIKFQSGLAYKVITSSFSKARKSRTTASGNILYEVRFNWNEVEEID